MMVAKKFQNIWIAYGSLLSFLTIASASKCAAEIAQLGERQTEDLKVPGSIPGLGIIFTALLSPSLLVCKPCGA